MRCHKSSEKDDREGSLFRLPATAGSEDVACLVPAAAPATSSNDPRARRRARHLTRRSKTFRKGSLNDGSDAATRLTVAERVGHAGSTSAAGPSPNGRRLRGNKGRGPMFRRGECPRHVRYEQFVQSTQAPSPVELWPCGRPYGGAAATQSLFSQCCRRSVSSLGGAPIRVSAGSPGLLPSLRSLLLGPAKLRPLDDAHGRRGVLGAASIGTVVGARCAVGVQGSPTGRGAGSLCHAPPSRRGERSIGSFFVNNDIVVS